MQVVTLVARDTSETNYFQFHAHCRSLVVGPFPFSYAIPVFGFDRSEDMGSFPPPLWKKGIDDRTPSDYVHRDYGRDAPAAFQRIRTSPGRGG